MRFHLIAVICNSPNEFKDFIHWMPNPLDQDKFKIILREEQARGLCFKSYIEIGAPDKSPTRKRIVQMVISRIDAYNARLVN